MTETAPSLPLGKHFASTDKKARDKAIQALVGFLSASSHELPTSEMSKLWKGIFYCYWMSDKPLVQQALASEIAEITLSIPSTEGTLAFLRGFWQAIVREWNGIDRLRMDKYYMLVRRFLNASFRFLQRKEWSTTACTEYMDILTDKQGPLTDNDPRTPTSLAYHVTEIYIPEMDKVLAESPADARPAPLIPLIEPFIAIICHSNSKQKCKQVQDNVFQPLFTSLDSCCKQDKDDDDDEPPRKRVRSDALVHVCRQSALDPHPQTLADPHAVRKALSQRLFEAACAEHTRDTNRRRIYDFLKGVGWDVDQEDDM